MRTLRIHNARAKFLTRNLTPNNHRKDTHEMATKAKPAAKTATKKAAPKKAVKKVAKKVVKKAVKKVAKKK